MAATVVHLNRYHHFTELMRDPRVEGQWLRYRSDHDGTTQSELILRPAGRRSDRLFFFFHGMDGDCGDAVIVRGLVTSLGATVVAMGGRGASWVSNAFLADAAQIMRRHAAGFSGCHLAGVSMGGTQALCLAALLPDDLRRSVLGVLALIPGADLPTVIEASSNERVRNTLRASVDGDVSVLRERSPAALVQRYTPNLPFVIVGNREDTLLPSGALTAFIARLREAGHPVTLFGAPGNHDFTYTDFDYNEAIGSMGRDSTFDRPPLLSGVLVLTDPAVSASM
jgi:pimeloyl-ACP methyl ester carboxylesterase